MTRNFGALASVVLTLGFVTYACTSGEVVDGPVTAGSAGSGPGSGGTGNTTGIAGTTGTGNVTGQAGTGNVTGQAGRGGTTGTGNVTGQAGRGGTTGTGNVTGQAGTTGTGNTTGQAGTTGTGNTTGQAGTTGSGGSAQTCAPTFDVASNGYVQAPAAGGRCWHGYSFTYTETPNCGSTVTPKDFAACGTPCNLSASGTVFPATAANSYCGVVGMGFNIGQDASSTSGTNVTPTGTGITITFTESAGSNEFRVNLVDSSGMAWCYKVATPASGSATILYSAFQYQCWDGGMKTPYAMQPFASIAIQTIGGAANATYSMSIKSVKEN